MGQGDFDTATQILNTIGTTEAEYGKRIVDASKEYYINKNSETSNQIISEIIDFTNNNPQYDFSNDFWNALFFVTSDLSRTAGDYIHAKECSQVVDPDFVYSGRSGFEQAADVAILDVWMLVSYYDATSGITSSKSDLQALGNIYVPDSFLFRGDNSYFAAFLNNSLGNSTVDVGSWSVDTDYQDSQGEYYYFISSLTGRNYSIAKVENNELYVYFDGTQNVATYESGYEKLGLGDSQN